MAPEQKDFEKVETMEERTTDAVVHLSLPQKPGSGELADDHLQQIAAGAGTFLLIKG